MKKLDITRVLKTLDTAKVGVLEWQFHQNCLVIDTSFFSILNESTQEKTFKFHFLWQKIHRSDRKKVLSAIRACINNNVCIDINLQLETPNNRYIRVQAQGQLQKGKNGAPEYLTTIITDISTEYSTNKKLQLNTERLIQAPEFAKIILWEVYAEYRETGIENRTFWWSDSFYQILGYRREDIKKTEAQFYELMHPEDYIRVQQDLKTMTDENHQLMDMEFRLKHRTQGYIWMHSVGRRQQIKDSIFKSLGAIININDLKLAQQEAKIKNLELQQTNQDLEHFAYAASHDLKAPLRGIKSLSGWIQEDLEQPSEAVKQNLDLMIKRITRMENLLADILAYSRAGKHHQEAEEIHIARLIEEIWDYAEPPADFKLKLDLQSSSLKAPKTLLEQTLSNLIVNAIKHHDKKQGLIKISYRIESSYHHFSVKDDGPGIESKFKDRVFEIFQTLRPRDEVEGSGVGLAIVKKTIDATGGSVWLQSNSDQRGAQFNFTLPLDAGRISPEWKSLGLFDNAS